MKHIAFLSVKWMSVGLGMLSLLLSVASCGDKEYGDAMNEAQLMNDIEVNVGSSLPLAVGMDFVLDYKPVPENVTNPEITLTSSDENVVSVSQDGRVTAKMIGKAYINLSQSTAFETLKTIEVQVMPVATAIELENVELFEGTNKKVIVNVTPSDGYNVFDWKSDNEEVATVADDGTITGKKPGTANISVSSQDGSQLTATAVVTVKEVIPIDKITLSEPGYDMMIGDKTLINCLLEPIDASVGLLSWSTTNDRVATVDADGLVTAVGAGEAEIIAQDPLSGLSASIAVKVVGEGVVSLSLSYVRNQDELKALVSAMDGEPGDLLLFAADKNKIVWNVLGALRLDLGHKMGLIDENKFNFLWVTEFPLLEWSEEENRFVAMHHPFTMPMEEDWQYIDSDPGRVRAKAYDIVLNGVELGGGSVRIHQDDIQEKMFEVIGIKKEEAWDRFGFLLSAFKYGVPPHAGLAYGLDRMVMLLVKADSIREVMAFPKVKDASCLMSEAPNVVDQKQLDELCLAVVKPEQKKEAGEEPEQA